MAGPACPGAIDSRGGKFSRWRYRDEWTLVEQAVGASLMKECSSSGACDSHHVGVGSWLLGAPSDQLGIYANIFASLQDPVARFIVADEPCTGQRKVGAELRQINQEIAGRAACSAVIRKNIRQRVLIWPRIDDFDVVNNPVACAENSFAIAHLAY